MIKSEFEMFLKQQKIAPLPIAASRTVNLGGTVATVGFPDNRFAGVRAQAGPVK
jgi:hypothetical protein